MAGDEKIARTHAHHPGFGPALYQESVVVDLRTAGARILSHVRGQDITVEVALVETKAERVASIIFEEAKRWSADLISMGTHGRRGLTRLALGSDAELVLRSTPVPILLVRDADTGE